jgi:hypothetical protein
MSRIGTPPPSSETTPESLYLSPSKTDVSEPVAYGTALAVLLAIRLVTAARRRGAT